MVCLMSQKHIRDIKTPHSLADNFHRVVARQKCPRASVDSRSLRRRTGACGTDTSTACPATAAQRPHKTGGPDTSGETRAETGCPAAT